MHSNSRAVTVILRLAALTLLPAIAFLAPRTLGNAASTIKFTLKQIPFRLENGEMARRRAPGSMAGGVAVFDYNKDGRPDIFFTNGANLVSLQKDDPKFSNRLVPQRRQRGHLPM